VALPPSAFSTPESLILVVVQTPSFAMQALMTAPDMVSTTPIPLIPVMVMT
jgi:hypothetical protein